MWGAIKSDLLSFVTTITDDTTKTINRVLGDDEPEVGRCRFTFTCIARISDIFDSSHQQDVDVSIQEKLIADLRRSFETYDTVRKRTATLTSFKFSPCLTPVNQPIREGDQRDYERFKKKFNLSSSAADIASVLDEEPEVSRFYAELVPIKLTPEEFWSRYGTSPFSYHLFDKLFTYNLIMGEMRCRLFFRVHQINRNGGVALDEEDDEEELVWDEEETFTPDPSANSTASLAPSTMAPSTLSSVESQGNDKVGTTKSSQTLISPTVDAGVSAINPTSQSATQTISHAVGQVDVNELITVNQHMSERVVALEQENCQLQSHEEALNRRIRELEALLAAQASVVMTHIRAEPPTPASQLSSASSATTPQSNRAQETGAVPATTPPSHAYFNTATPPTATAATSGHKKNTASTAKKLFDSPAAGADVTLRGELDTMTTAEGDTAEPSAVRNLAGSPVSAPAVRAASAPEYASQSSEDSGVVVNPSDANSLADLADDEPPALPAPSAAARPPTTTVAPSVSTASAADGASPVAAVSKTGFSQETAKYLAALDDQEEEEDGWN
jgi:hypothetical protein